MGGKRQNLRMEEGKKGAELASTSEKEKRGRERDRDRLRQIARENGRQRKAARAKMAWIHRTNIDYLRMKSRRKEFSLQTR